MGRTKYWLSVPVKTGRKRVYFPSGQELRLYLYDLAKATPDGRVLSVVRLPKDLPGYAELDEWLARTAQQIGPLHVTGEMPLAPPGYINWKKIGIAALLIALGYFLRSKKHA